MVVLGSKASIASLEIKIKRITTRNVLGLTPKSP
jgi:hypothetical protein